MYRLAHLVPRSSRRPPSLHTPPDSPPLLRRNGTQVKARVRCAAENVGEIRTISLIKREKRRGDVPEGIDQEAYTSAGDILRVKSRVASNR